MEEVTVVALPRPESVVATDPPLAVLREGARRMLMQAIEVEVEAFLATNAGMFLKNPDAELAKRNLRPEDRARLLQGLRAAGLPVLGTAAAAVTQLGRS